MSPRRPPLLAICALAGATVATRARADEPANAAITGHVEPGVAFPVSSPQSDHFGVGGGAFAKLGYAVHPFVDLQGAIGVLGFGAKQIKRTDPTNPVSIALFGAGIRLSTGHRRDGITPWADIDLGLVRTGQLTKFGLDVGVGARFGLGGLFGIGPFVRLVEVTSQQEDFRVDSSNAHILMAGAVLDIDVGTLIRGDKAPPPLVSCDCDAMAAGKCAAGQKPTSPCLDTEAKSEEPPPPPADKCPKGETMTNEGCAPTDTDNDGVPDVKDRCPTQLGENKNGCPDTDKDGVNDGEDLCPKLRGTAAQAGCPRYKFVIIREDKIDLVRKIAFADDRSAILPKSFGLLDELARALQDASNVRIRIEGHTDATGNVERNTSLSEARAMAVKDYLPGRGIAADRLEAKGFGPTQPIETNATAIGREHNRRVEFMIIKPAAAQPAAAVGGNAAGNEKEQH